MATYLFINILGIVLAFFFSLEGERKTERIKMVANEKNFEREIEVVCKKCGAQLSATIFYTKHRTGNCTATIANIDAPCYYCATKKQEEGASPSSQKEAV